MTNNTSVFTDATQQMNNIPNYSEIYRRFCREQSINIDKKFILWIDEVEQLVITGINVKLIQLDYKDFYSFFKRGKKAQLVANDLIGDNMWLTL